MNRREFLRITAAAGVVLGAAALGPWANEAPGAVQAMRTLMGTRVHLTVIGPDAQAAQAAITATFGAMQRLIDCFDFRRPTSALAALNRNGRLADPPASLVDLLRWAVAYGELTGGAFDVTIKPLLDAWRKGATGVGALGQRAALVDYRQIEISQQMIRLGIPGASVTLDGIAKGRVIDGGVAALQALGYEQVLVEAGGDLRTAGAGGGSPWRVGVAHPRQVETGTIAAVLPLTAQAVATSGDYMNNFTADFRCHHIIDPRSGQSPAELASATVVAASALAADALATALMVLGADAGLRLAERLPGVEALLIRKDLQVLKTSGLAVL